MPIIRKLTLSLSLLLGGLSPSSAQLLLGFQGVGGTTADGFEALEISDTANTEAFAMINGLGISAIPEPATSAILFALLTAGVVFLYRRRARS